MNAFIQEEPVTVLPTLACAIGLEQAIVLQQIYQWSGANNAIKIELEKWYEHFSFWSEETLQQVLEDLENLNLLVVTQNSEGEFCKVSIRKLHDLQMGQVRGSDL